MSEKTIDIIKKSEAEARELVRAARYEAEAERVKAKEETEIKRKEFASRLSQMRQERIRRAHLMLEKKREEEKVRIAELMKTERMKYEEKKDEAIKEAVKILLG